MSERPALSVVVVTHERPRLLDDAIDSVCHAMTAFDGDAELVVVDSSETPVSVDRDHPVRVLHRPDEKPAAAKRNTGRHAATHDWIVYMDDDCEMVEDALATIARAVEDAHADVSGLFGVTEFAGPRTLWFDAFAGTDFMTDFEWAEDGGQVDWGPTSIAVFRASALDAVDGFRHFDTSAGGEDVDLCLRLRRNGTELHGIPAVLVHHTTSTWNNPRDNFNRAFRYGFAESELVVRHPDSTRFIRLPKATLACSTLGVTAALAAGLLAPVAGVATLLALAASWFLGNAVVEHLRFPSPPAETLVLTAYRRAYGFGSTWYKLRHGPRANLLRRFDWTFGDEGPFWHLERVDYVQLAAALLPLAALALLR